MELHEKWEKIEQIIFTKLFSTIFFFANSKRVTQLRLTYLKWAQIFNRTCQSYASSSRYSNIFYDISELWLFDHNWNWKQTKICQKVADRRTIRNDFANVKNAKCGVEKSETVRTLLSNICLISNERRKWSKEIKNDCQIQNSALDDNRFLFNHIKIHLIQKTVAKRWHDN